MVPHSRRDQNPRRVRAAGSTDQPFTNPAARRQGGREKKTIACTLLDEEPPRDLRAATSETDPLLNRLHRQEPGSRTHWVNAAWRDQRGLERMSGESLSRSIWQMPGHLGPTRRPLRSQCKTSTQRMTVKRLGENGQLCCDSNFHAETSADSPPWNQSIPLPSAPCG